MKKGVMHCKFCAYRPDARLAHSRHKKRARLDTRGSNTCERTCAWLSNEHTHIKHMYVLRLPHTHASAQRATARYPTERHDPIGMTPPCVRGTAATSHAHTHEKSVRRQRHINIKLSIVLNKKYLKGQYSA